MVQRCTATERKLDAINKEYYRNEIDQQVPKSLREMEECIRLIALDKQKSHTMLFEAIEAEVTSKLEFIDV